MKRIKRGNIHIVCYSRPTVLKYLNNVIFIYVSHILKKRLSDFINQYEYFVAYTCDTVGHCWVLCAEFSTFLYWTVANQFAVCCAKKWNNTL